MASPARFELTAPGLGIVGLLNRINGRFASLEGRYGISLPCLGVRFAGDSRRPPARLAVACACGRSGGSGRSCPILHSRARQSPHRRMIVTELPNGLARGIE